MNGAASNLADKKELWGAVHSKRPLQAEGSRNKEVNGASSRLVVAGPFPSGDGRVCEAGDPTSAEQLTPDGLV